MLLPKDPLVAIPLIGALEFYGSRIFDTDKRSWDYSDLPLNIEGRICIPILVLMAVALAYLSPMVEEMALIRSAGLVGLFLISCLATIFKA